MVASACVVMEASLAAARGIEPLGRYCGMAVVGTEPDEMGIGPVFAVPKLLKRFDLKMDDIGLWEPERSLRRADGSIAATGSVSPMITAMSTAAGDLHRPSLWHVRQPPG